MNPTSLSFCLSYNSTLTLMKLFLLPSGSISMHQREEPANTLCSLFYGHLSFSVFFQSLPIPCSLFSFSIPGISVNSVVSTRYEKPQKLMDDGLEMQFLGCYERKAVGEAEAHLIAEYRECSGTRSVGLYRSVLEDMLEQINVLFHL